MASVFGSDPRPAMLDFMKKFEAKYAARPITSHAVTGYSVIEAWTRAVEKAGTLEADKVRDALQQFNKEPLLAGPTTFTPDAHINMQRDLVLMEVKDGKQGTVVGVIAAAEAARLTRAGLAPQAARGRRNGRTVGNCARPRPPAPGGRGRHG